VVQGEIVRLIGFGAFVELEEGVEGLCHVSELDEKRAENLESTFKIGQQLNFKIIKLNLLERKIGLSIRALKEQVDAKDEAWSYAPQVGTASLGEIAREQLDELKKKAEIAEGNENDES
jgi:small subunit ribosomal protein S1